MFFLIYIAYFVCVKDICHFTMNIKHNNTLVHHAKFSYIYNCLKHLKIVSDILEILDSLKIYYNFVALQ